MVKDTIVINVIDRRNLTYSKSIPFKRYSPPKIELIKLENATELDGTIILYPPESTLHFKISSDIGLTKVEYVIGDKTQVINLNGDKEYILTIKIS